MVAAIRSAALCGGPQLQRAELEELLETVLAQFPPAAGLLEASEWSMDVELSAIDVHLARAHLLRDALCPVLVRRPYRRGETVYGSVDKKTQRAAWTVADRKTPVYEAGIANLTKTETTLLVHYSKDNSQQFTLVRIEQPEGEEQPEGK